MMKKIDDFLNVTTMYRLLVYYLVYLLIVAILAGFLGKVPYSPQEILLSTGVIWLMAWATNHVFAWGFNAPTNLESSLITALILSLIMSPASDVGGYISLGWIAIVAIASKYLIAIKKKHIFNPAALAVFTGAWFFGNAASWWVGTKFMMPFVAIPGWLIVRKIRRGRLVTWFFIMYFAVMMLVTYFFDPATLLTNLSRGVVDSPVFFFAFVMLTEPLTMPNVEYWQMMYGILVGVLFVPQLGKLGLAITPEEALLLGNIFAYIVSPKTKVMLTLRKIVKLGNDMYDFVFDSDAKLKFRPGQYLEWTVPHEKPDSRGNRRYFTIASAPQEENMRVGVKFYPNPSSFKRQLSELKPGDMIAAGQLAGDFVLPKDVSKKLVLVAGGIGITPMESMVNDLMNRGERRDIYLLYSNKDEEEIAYKDTFDRAEKEIGLKVIYTLTKEEGDSWKGERGHISSEMIKRRIPDYKSRVFYISGSHGMVMAVVQELKKLGVSDAQIVTDYFPGFV